jgi:hypothetical protein
MEATLRSKSGPSLAQRRGSSPSQTAAAPASASVRAFPLEVEFGRDYWLGRCTGFTVEADGRPCGRVEWLRYGSRLDRPDALVVRRCRLRRRRFIVRAEAVREIDPWLERVYLRSAAAGDS